MQLTLNDRIIHLLETRRKLRAKDMARLLEYDMVKLSYALVNLRTKKRIHISEWRYPQHGGMAYAVWMLGDRESAKKPPPRPKIDKDVLKAKTSVKVTIQPDVAAAWLMNPDYLAEKRCERIVKSGELGAKQKLWRDLLAA